MREWIEKKAVIFVKNLLLDNRPVIYTCTVISVSADEKFVTVMDRNNRKVTINTSDIIQIKEDEYAV